MGEGPWLDPLAKREHQSEAVPRSMKLYVLRHERRSPYEASFDTPLTEEGNRRAGEIVVGKLEQVDPTHVYSSPFLRVLQTIEPYMKKIHKHNLDAPRAKVEYSLYEFPNPEPYPYVSFVPEEWLARFYVDPDYQSFMTPEELKEWGFVDLHRRTARFLKHLIEKHGATNDKILLASHRFVAHSLMHVCTRESTRHMDMRQGQVVELDWENAAPDFFLNR